jgi:hypothetical protein
MTAFFDWVDSLPDWPFVLAAFLLVLTMLPFAFRGQK